MRKATTLKPQIWTKPKFLGLTPDGKLVFLFLITGPDTNLTGIVRYPIDMISMSTGLSPIRVDTALEILVKKNRILWDRQAALIYVVNWLRHNPIKGERLRAGYLHYLTAFDGHPFRALAEKALVSTPYDTPSIGYRQGIDTLIGTGTGIPTPILGSPTPAEYCGARPELLASPAMVMMPVKDGEEPITEGDVALWSGLYGRIDVRQSLNKMVGYWAALPKSKRKTRSGIRKSINTWLAKDDDRAPVGASPSDILTKVESEPWK